MTRGVIIYSIDDSGTLTGRWTQLAEQSGAFQSGTEKAVRQSRAGDIAGNYDATIFDSTGVARWTGVLQIDGTSDAFKARWTPDKPEMGVFEGVGFLPDSAHAVAAYWSTG